MIRSKKSEKKLKKDEIPSVTRGGMNLMILGVASILVAVLTTSVSLIIYHNSGDIYLDRSRPGFLPDEEEIEENAESEAENEFEKSGKVTVKVLEEYLEGIKADIDAIDLYSAPFGPEALSDKYLDILTQ